jgi:hypothetical protein
VTRTAAVGTVADVKGGWLEHEIRSLPQVLACSITKDDVVVLVQPSADPVTVERAVEDLLRRSAIDLPVRVFGGARPVFVEPVKVRNGRTALVGTLGGAAILAAGVWLAGASTGLRGGGPKTRATVAAAVAPPVARELLTIPVVGGDGAAVPVTPPEEPPPPLLRPVRPPLFRNGRVSPPTGPIRPPSRPPDVKPPVTGPPVTEPPVTGPPVTEPPVTEPPVTEPPTTEPPGARPPAPASCNAPHSGVEPKPKRGRGNGPPPWSHSIHNPAHCNHGRPR